MEKQSGCKVNLLLNVLSRREDGFHELETLLYPVAVFDRLSFARTKAGVHLTCNHPRLPTDSRNLVHRAAAKFLEQAQISAGVQLHLEKNIPLEAGLGGGSANAATTLSGLNELFDQPLTSCELQAIAAALGSDVPFFLQEKPALALGRGEQIRPLEGCAALAGAWVVLIHPGFGISTAWAYGQLSRFPSALRGAPGRAERLAALLRTADLKTASEAFYNSLEAPALEKYPILALYQEFLREHGALGARMSGSGSSTFALTPDQSGAESLLKSFKAKFGESVWTAAVPV